MTTQPLKGRKVLVTGIDLEQSEHRGIAVYSKSLIRCLSDSGAEVWLLTEFFDNLSRRGLKHLPEKTKAMIHRGRILNLLASGKDNIKPFKKKFKLIQIQESIENKLSHYIKLVVNILIRPRKYKSKDLASFRLDELYDNPNIRIERLNYMENITGIVSAPDIYLATQLAARLPKLKPVLIDLEGFDALITSCPLNIKPINLPHFVQSIHDLIALEYVPHNEDPLMFSHRLQACRPARRLFVSRSTAYKFNTHIQTDKKSSLPYSGYQANDSYEKVIVQPPSLHFPNWLTEDRENIVDLPPASPLFRADPDSTDRRKNLTPFRYFLFNSSVESRKNLLFLAKAYAETDLSKNGIKLCVTGKLKPDDYSNSLKKIVDYEDGIILTDYVNESSKLDLYLNALGLLSPSLVEGFGIPVLDSACLGMPSLASDCESHIEIKGLYDFENHVFCLETNNSRKWAAAMQKIAGSNMSSADQASQVRRKRISRYSQFESKFTNQLKKDLVEILN